MAGLQRSAISFRRQGSSGSVWDDKFLAELNKQHQQELQEQQQKQQQEEDLKQGLSTEPQLESTKQEKGGADQLRRSKSDGGRGTPAHGYKAVKVAELEEPPSPKVAACGFCGVFGRSPAKKGGATTTKSSGKST